MAAYPLAQAVALTLLTLPVATSATLLRQSAAPLPDHAIPSALRATESRPMRYTAPSRTGTTDLIRWGKISGRAPGDINYERSDTTALTTAGGSGGNVFNANDTISVGTTTINGGGGADTFNIAANNLGGGSTNNFNGQGGDDVFAVTGSLGSLVTLDIDGGLDMDTLSVPPGSTTVPTGPDSGSVTGVVTHYTSIETGPGPSPTPTATPTSTPTVTPTLAALGTTCTSGTQCASTFCAPDGVCCNVPCAEPNQSCTLPGSVGLCRVLGSVAPAVSRPGLIMLGLVLAALGVVSLRRTLIARR